MLIPPGFNTVTAYAVVEQADRFIAFLVGGLGGTEVLRHLDGTRIAHAQVRIGDSTLMVSEATPDFAAMPLALYLFVDDADAAMARALAAGATQIMEVGDKPYGDRQGGIRDAFGNIWWLSQRLVEGPY